MAARVGSCTQLAPVVINYSSLRFMARLMTTLAANEDVAKRVQETSVEETWETPFSTFEFIY